MKKDYSKKIIICEKLGAKTFQKFVFFIEKLKFKTIKKVFPNFINNYDKFCNFKMNKKLKKVHSEQSKQKIINYYRKQKLAIRKEFNLEQNRNYHINKNKPSEIIHYLNWNKDVHVKGLIMNLILIPSLITAILCGLSILTPYLLIEIFSLFINFECVNIQNYNIYRFKEKEDKLLKIEDKTQKMNLQKYDKAIQVIDKTLTESKEIPSIDDLINNIKDKEQLIQLRNMISKTIEQNNYTTTVSRCK